MNEPGILLVVSGPSGAGKSTVIGSLLRRRPDIYFSISATTRKPRPGEENGVNYWFVDKPRFEGMIADGELLEYAEYVGNYYGTPRRPVEEMLASGGCAILDIEVKGAAQVKTKIPEAIMVFVMPSSFEQLEKRLCGRATEDVDAIEDRMQTARREYEAVRDYDYLVINDDVELAVDQLSTIIEAESMRTFRRLERIKG